MWKPARWSGKELKRRTAQRPLAATSMLPAYETLPAGRSVGRRVKNRNHGSLGVGRFPSHHWAQLPLRATAILVAGAPGIEQCLANDGGASVVTEKMLGFVCWPWPRHGAPDPVANKHKQSNELTQTTGQKHCEPFGNTSPNQQKDFEPSKTQPQTCGNTIPKSFELPHHTFTPPQFFGNIILNHGKYNPEPWAIPPQMFGNTTRIFLKYYHQTIGNIISNLSKYTPTP